jgi:hypothetical protein
MGSAAMKGGAPQSRYFSFEWLLERRTRFRSLEQQQFRRVKQFLRPEWLQQWKCLHRVKRVEWHEWGDRRFLWIERVCGRDG